MKKFQSNFFDGSTNAEFYPETRRSVTRWINYLFNIWSFGKLAQWHEILAMVGSKHGTQNERFQNGQSSLTVSQSGEISPKLVTLSQFNT